LIIRALLWCIEMGGFSGTLWRLHFCRGGEPLHLTRGSNSHFYLRASALGSNGFHLLHYVHTFCHLSKDNVLSVQPGGDNGRDEELGPCELDLLCVSESRQTCEPLVLGPALAIDKSPGRLCLSLKFSSTGAVENG